MKTSLILFAGLWMTGFSLQAYGQLRQHDIRDLNIRDPFIVADAQKGIYYMYGSASQKGDNGTMVGGVAVYRSRDLQTWEGPQQVFTVPADNWITGTVWAPEVHVYKGRYYLFATLTSDLEWKRRQKDWSPFTYRGTQIFHADLPEGPFLPFGRTPHTPMDWMALDGTLWVEDGTPRMVFCHEWIQMGDGTMDVVELKPDLSAPAGAPLRLFHASSAPWVVCAPKDQNSYVTDGCFLYRSKAGKLMMIWSSFTAEGYATGLAESTTGKVTGPWKQHNEPLLNQNGGHGMIFRTLDGRLCLVLHQPNHPGGAERAHIFEIEDTGEALVVQPELTKFK